MLESLAANAVRVAPTGLVSPTLTLDVRITKMKDGRTHLTHKAEYAIDIETGAIVAITLHGADEGDTETIQDTVAEAGERITSVVADSDSQVAHHQQPEVDL